MYRLCIWQIYLSEAEAQGKIAFAWKIHWHSKFLQLAGDSVRSHYTANIFLVELTFPEDFPHCCNENLLSPVPKSRASTSGPLLFSSLKFLLLKTPSCFLPLYNSGVKEKLEMIMMDNNNARH